MSSPRTAKVSTERRWTGFVEVWPSQTTEVYVKHFHRVDSDAFLESFMLQEASRVSPNVPTFYEQQLVDGELRVCSEYCSGGTLSECLPDPRKQGFFERERIKQIIITMLETIRTLHDNRIAHRKLSAKSWVFTDDGKPKLISFGAAKLVRDKDTVDLHTVRNVPLYSSPEVVQAMSQSSLVNNVFKQDIWAIGKIIFELLMKKISCILHSQLQEKIENEVKTELRECGFSFMETAILGMLNTDMDARFTAGEALEAALESINPRVSRSPVRALEGEQPEEAMRRGADYEVHQFAEVCSACHKPLAKGKGYTNELCDSCFQEAKRSCPPSSAQTTVLNETTSEDVPSTSYQRPPAQRHR